MKKISLSLDWTPNINHIGFFVAQGKGFYEDLDLKVIIDHPGLDGYKMTPAKKVENGLADFALCPIESVLSYRTKSSPFSLIAVAAILQEDLSAIAVRSDALINSPKDLDGMLYASYKARYEDHIVKQLIKNDGGTGNISLAYPEKLGIWETLVKGGYDATWVFTNWEGVQVQNDDISFTYFKMEDYSIPYSYSPVLAANEELISNKREDYKNFLLATKKGYAFCQEYPEEAIAILSHHIPAQDQNIDLEIALKKSLKAFGVGDHWGSLERENVLTFLRWLQKHKLEETGISVDQLITNDLL